VRLFVGVLLAWLAYETGSAPIAAAAPCDRDGWCAETLVPGAAGHTRFTAVWSDRPDDVWVVGVRADTEPLAFHWDGSAWTPAPPPTTGSLNDVWGSGPRDVWAVGAAGVALHWNGDAWSSVPTGASASLSRVSGTSGRDVWAIGRAGLYHWNGESWALDPRLAVDAREEFLGDIWAVSPRDVWVALGFTSRGSVARFDGTSWKVTQASPETAFGLFGVWSNGKVTWAVGEGDQILRRAHGSWTQRRPPAGSSQGLVNVMAAGADMYASRRTVVHTTAGGPIQTVTGVPDGAYPGLWVNATQIWVAGSSNAGGAVVLHRAR
jgi:hypothetical protein